MMLGKYERVSQSEETTFPFPIGAERNILTHTSRCRESREQYRWTDIATTSRQRRLRRARINLRNERRRGRGGGREPRACAR